MIQRQSCRRGIQILFVILTMVLLNTESRAETATAFEAIPETFSPSKDCSTMLAHKPAGTDQGMFPICSATATQWLYKQFYCRIMKLNDCADVPMTLLPNIWEMSGMTYGRERHQQSDDGNEQQVFDPGFIYIHGADRGGFPILSLKWIVNSKNNTIATEDCSGLGDLLKRANGNASLIGEAFGRMEALYNQNKNNKNPCFDCINAELLRDFDTSVNESSLRVDLSLPTDADTSYSTFEKYAYRVLLKKCVPMTLPGELHYYGFPESVGNIQEVKSSYDDAVKQLRILFAADRGVVIGVCEGSWQDDKKLHCTKGYGHAVALAGICNMCDTATGTCRDAILVMNSWGEDWQRRHHDGWVDARVLYDHIFPGGDNIVWIDDEDNPLGTLTSAKLINTLRTNIQNVIDVVDKSSDSNSFTVDNRRRMVQKANMYRVILGNYFDK